jgi:hypothetical protein
MTHAAGECPAGGFAHRWSTGYSRCWLVGRVSTVQVSGSGNAGFGWSGVVGTLLGPEGTGARAPGEFLSLFLRAASDSVCLVGGWGLGGRVGRASHTALVPFGFWWSWWWLLVGFPFVF